MIRYFGSPHWKPSTIEDLVFFQRGFDITKAEQKEGEVPVISSSGTKSYHSQSKVSGPGVVIGRKGTLGSVFYSECDYWPHDTTLWSKDFKGNNPKFVYYALKLIRFENFDAGAANPTLNRNHIHGLPITIPELTVQDDIVSVLEKYDELIENNKRRIELLEESARQLYKEWFVRFRFPGHEHVKIIDGVPEGWRSLELSEAVAVIKDTVDPKNLPEETPYLGLEHLPRRSFTLNNWESAGKVTSTKYAFQTGDILFGKIRPYFHKVGFSLVDGITSSDAIVMRPRLKKYYFIVLSEVSSDQFVALASKTVREGSKMPRADWDVLKKRVILEPPQKTLDVFNNQLESILSQCKLLSFQMANLAKARDLLLPKLMSGEIAV